MLSKPSFSKGRKDESERNGRKERPKSPLHLSSWRKKLVKREE
jgi:hypothetical protein